MPSLYSYCIPYDDGAAPNPFWGVCTLVICKPAIRRSAKKGDWIAGTGSKFARVGDGTTRDLSGHLVYAIKVTEKMTMKEYDAHTRTKHPDKIPDWSHSDHRRRLGDSLYDFSGKNVRQRPGVHVASNQATDLSGKHALLSAQFYYFGDQAVPLPGDLRPIAQNRQGHRRALNGPYVEKFITWIERNFEPCTLRGKPLLNLFLSKSKAACGWCASGRAEDDEQDVEDSGPGC